MSEQKAAYVYILGDHEESGTTNAVATLDRAKLPAMLETWFAEIIAALPEQCRGWTASAVKDYENRVCTCRDEAAAGLARRLAESDVVLSAADHPHPLGRSWGGVTLIVARLV